MAEETENKEQSTEQVQEAQAPAEAGAGEQAQHQPTIKKKKSAVALKAEAEAATKAAEKKEEAPKPAQPYDASKEINLLDQLSKTKKTPEEIRKEKIEALKNKWDNIRSKWWFKLFVMIVIGVLILYAIWCKLPMLTEKKLPDVMENNGLAMERFQVIESEMDHILVKNISMKQGQVQVKSMRIDFSFLDLLRNSTIKKMVLDGVTLGGKITDDEIDLGVLFDVLSTKGASGDLAVVINNLDLRNGTYSISRVRKEPVLDEEGEPIDETKKVVFSATGKVSKKGVNLIINTNYDAPDAKVSTKTVLNKTSDSSEIKTEVTEGVLLEGEKTVGSIEGNVEVSVQGGALSKGGTDLILKSKAQKLVIKSEVTPHDDKYDLTLNFERSFETMADASGKFVGSAKVTAKDIEFKGNFSRFSGTLPLKIYFDSLTNGSMAIQQLSLNPEMHVECEHGSCSFLLLKPMDFWFNSAVYQTKFRRFTFPQPLQLKVNPDEAEKNIKYAKGDLSFSLPMTGFTTSHYVSDSFGNMPVSMAINGSKLHVKTNIFTGGIQGDYVFTQSAFANSDFTMQGMQGKVLFNGGLPTGQLVASAVTLKKENILVPFGFNAIFKPTKMNEFNIQSEVKLLNGVISSTVGGTYDIYSHKWNLYINVPEITFNDDLTIAQVYPYLTNLLSPDTKGTFAAKGRLVMENGKIEGPLEVMVKNVNTQISKVKIEGVSGVLTLTSLLPFGSADNQMLYADVFDMGIPLNGFLANFKVIPNQGLNILSASAKYADGQFKTIKSSTVPFDGNTTTIVAEGNGVNMSKLSKSLAMNNIEADGILNTTWNFKASMNSLFLEGGIFKSDKGMLKFASTPEIKNMIGIDTAKFLREVMFKKLEIRAAGDMHGPVQFKAKIPGKSPLGEQDTSVSVGFTKPFSAILKKSNEIVDMPTDIRLKLQNFKN